MEMQKILRFFDRDQLAKYLDIELLEVLPGQATARMVIQKKKHHNGVGMTHGGAIFTLADFAFAAACNSYGTVAVAVNVNISFLKATSEGTLIARAREVAKSNRLGTYHIEIFDETGEIVASFQGTAYRKKDPLPFDQPVS